jgi:phosphoribosyl 1,2-cyclic phosphodiesterase
MQSRFTITFRGVRGSYAVPGKGTTGIGGNTPCVEIRAGSHVLIFDAGTGIIDLGRQLVGEHLQSGPDEESREPVVATIFFSHMHHDHTQGFPFFAPAYIRGTTLFVFGPRIQRHDLEETLTQALLTPFFPVDLDEMAAELAIRNLNDHEAVIFAPDSREPIVVNVVRSRPAVTPEHVVVRSFRGYAHPGGIRYYRIDYAGKSVTYATDTEGYVGGDVNLARFAAGSNVLIHDAQYKETEYVGVPVPTQGYGHSTPAMAAAVAASAGVGKLVLFHHDPRHDDQTVRDMEYEAQRLFNPSIAAHEGMSLEVL